MNEPPLPPVPPAAPDFKDRRPWLIVFGVLEILLGVLAALVIPLMLLGHFMAERVAPDTMPLQQMVQGMVFYALLAVTFVWVGIGSCKARRWGRALSLILSWSWLLTGLLTWFFMLFSLPSFLKASQQQGPGMPEAAQAVLMVVVLAIIGFIFVLVPSVFVWFFQSRHVRATCLALDPVPRWTDACPLPLLALCLWLGFGALSLLLMPVSANGVLPLFGRLISGPPGWAGCVVLAGVMGYSAWAMYRLRKTGWWVAVVTIGLASISGFVTLTRVELIEVYRLMGYLDSQVEMMREFPFMQGHALAYLSLGGAAVMLGYLLFVRRYFHPQTGAVSPAT